EGHIGLAYTTTEDGNHEIQYEISLKDYSWTQYVDNKEVSNRSYLEDEDGEAVNKEQALEGFLLDLKYGEFDDYVRVDENDLREKLGLEIDDEDRKSTRLNSSHVSISYAVFCLKKKKRDIKYKASGK